MAYQFQNAKILVVEDTQPMATLVKSILNIFGFKNIYLADSGEEGLSMFKHHDPDLVLADWLMDGMDGVEMTRHIRNDADSQNPYVPVILMTGFSHQMRIVQARDIGINEFLAKPFNAHELYERIKNVIEKPRQYVDSGAFFGPDRRRKRGRDYNGPERRHKRNARGEAVDADPENARILEELRERAEQTQ
jgi:DNA-binding response OmpR family regulator